ncbi:MAG: TRAP transporter small permease subunit [Betaproteobacteria bacterium]
MSSSSESALAHAIRRVCDALLYTATAASIALTALVALSAIMRYLIGSPFAFTEELVGLLFVAMVFPSLPYCTMRRSHIAVTLVTERLPARARFAAAVVADLLTLLFCGWFGVFAWGFVATTWRVKSRTDFGGILLWPWMAMMLVSCALIAAAVFALWRGARPRPGDHIPRI